MIIYRRTQQVFMDKLEEASKIAIEQAGIKPEEIGYINAHSTSTPMNDKFETMSMK